MVEDAMRKNLSICLLLAMISPVTSVADSCECKDRNYAAGQCVAYVRQRVKQMSGIEIPWRGDARNWIGYAEQWKWNVGKTPINGAIAVFSIGNFGHVAYIENTSSDGSFTVSDCNYGSPVPDTPGGKTFCCGFTTKRCVGAVGPRTGATVTSAGKLGNAQLIGIIYPPGRGSPPHTIAAPVRTVAPNAIAAPVKTMPPVVKGQPQISYSVCISNIDDSGSVEVNGQTVLKVSKRGNQCANISLHSGKNPISFKVKNKKGDYSYHFAYRENGIVKWEKSCGDINGKGCGKKMKKGGTLSMDFTAKL